MTERNLLPEGQQLGIQKAGTATPYYLSVFFCPAEGA